MLSPGYLYFLKTLEELGLHELSWSTKAQPPECRLCAIVR